jgi:hypothetical protein
MKMPASSGFSDGAAYRNRTDDLRITRRITIVYGCPPVTSRPGYALVTDRFLTATDTADSTRIQARPGSLLALALARSSRLTFRFSE